MKICAKCKIKKNFSDFQKFKRNKDGYHSYCKQCKSILVKVSKEQIKQLEKIIPNFKKCCKCKIIKSQEMFDKCSTRLDGLRADCKLCHSTATKKRFAERRLRKPQEILEPKSKKCFTCKLEKNISDFGKANTQLDGRHGECKKCTNIRHISYKRKMPISKIRVLYNKNCCEICQNEFTHDKIRHIDHCHKTNNVRGVLCKICNALLGFAKDNVNILKNAIAYLEKDNDL